MKITRHNYEEYFILYMDNELSSEKRRMMEAFIEKNPDLKEELEIMKQFKLIPDKNIVFAGKENLLKTADDTIITAENFEENLLLYIDNELSDEQKSAFELFVAKNPAAQKELDLFSKSKLPAENIEFTFKESLYRKTEKARVIPVRWWRAAAAIIIIALGLSTFIILNNKRSADKDDIVNITNPDKITPQQLPGQENTGNPVVSIDQQKNPANNTNKKDKVEELMPVYNQPNNIIAVKENKPVNNKMPVYSPAPDKKEQPAIAENKPSNNLPLPVNNPNINSVPKDALAVNNSLVDKTPVNNVLTNPEVTTANPQPSDIIAASFNNNESGSKKSKLRGLFRKVTRTFEKRTNIDVTDGENRLLIAGLAFKVN
ncbi:MAG: hypothetical protein WBC06_02890 [Chitinophagaceae bacterium]